MITRLTKIQLIIFVIVTLVGGAFVGGRYAKIDRLVVDRSFPVTVQLKDSGGLFEGAQVTYRGIGVGRVGKMTFTNAGVKARLDIENNAPKIPSDVLAVVANKSAVGEQFMDLQPRTTTAPYLKSGSNVTVANTQIPVATTELLIHANDLVTSINTTSLKTVVDELGIAFVGTGEDLGRIIDTSTEFLQAANDNIGTTRALIRDSDSVLQTQTDKQGAISTFAKNLALFSDTLASADPDLRRLADGGAGSAKEIRQVVAENSKNLNVLVNNVITTNKPAFENTQALRSLFILFPYLLEGAPSTLAKNGDFYDAAFGNVLTKDPAVCNQGYRGYRGGPADDGRRPPRKLSVRGLEATVDCADSAKVPRNPSKTVVKKNRVPVAVYDPATGIPTSTGATDSTNTYSDPLAFGKDSWQWLLLGPTTTK
ncbi:MAG: MCE family protein [Kineosporiaceae bacterium]|nr:MCE family protein [Aeromicrobium sp.]